MSKIRFVRTIHGSVRASCSVRTTTGLRSAAAETMATGEDGRPSPEDYRTALDEMMKVVDIKRNGLS